MHVEDSQQCALMFSQGSATWRLLSCCTTSGEGLSPSPSPLMRFWDKTAEQPVDFWTASCSKVEIQVQYVICPRNARWEVLVTTGTFSAPEESLPPGPTPHAPSNLEGHSNGSQEETNVISWALGKQIISWLLFWCQIIPGNFWLYDLGTQNTKHDLRSSWSLSVMKQLPKPTWVYWNQVLRGFEWFRMVSVPRSPRSFHKSQYSVGTRPQPQPSCPGLAASHPFCGNLSRHIAYSISKSIGSI